MRLLNLVIPLVCALLSGIPSPARATEETPLSLADKAVTLTPNPAFRYVAAGDTKAFLERHWRGRPLAGGAGLGLLIPVGSAPEPAWLVVLSYDGGGHVSDLDAGRLDADALLAALKSAGGGTPRLTGWAQPPRYDDSSHTLVWATRSLADGGAVDALDYHVRLLGRRGVLNLDIAARMNDLPTIEGEMPALLSMIRFTPGNGYRDYVAIADRSVTLGLSGLIAGDALVKGGLLDHLWAGIRSQSFIYLVAVLIVMLGAPRLSRYWGPKPPPAPARDQEPPAPPPSPPRHEDHDGHKGPWS
ncbi:DUF2167 domain-containing protein [Nitrospirillum sp. BR 11752]|uniref:DUF2167 domain-containing protein n=1 Tax=Nitrospirillum sp. BR 11752 TaxID=3104293 RepID=UPI002EB257FE|nr:DUF2167 domain-containing protein [Nitrospirillum sp. BR 11752]